MKKMMFLMVVLFLAVSCNTVHPKTDDDRFNSLKSPVVVVAKSDTNKVTKTEGYFGFVEITTAVTLKDGTGKYVTFDGTTGLGSTLYSTFNLNDTIR